MPKFCGTLLSVTDMEASKKFYNEVLGLHVTMDLGTNVSLTGGLAMQSDFAEFLLDISPDNVHYRTNNFEIFFEEENYDSFLEKMKGFPEIEYVRTSYEQPWGQRSMRFYDPDHHIIEVGEAMKSVIQRFFCQGLTDEDVMARTGYPMALIKKWHGSLA